MELNIQTKSLLVFSIGLLTISISNAQTIRNTPLNGLLNICDTNTVITSLLKSDSNCHYFNLKKYSKYFEPHTHQLSFSNAGEQKKVYNWLVDEFSTLKTDEQNKVIVYSKKWCDQTHTIDSLLKDYDVPGDQVIYNIDETKKLFNKYLVDKRQTWESLTLWQSEELYVDLMNHLSTLNTRKTKEFYRNFSKTAKRLSNTDN